MQMILISQPFAVAPQLLSIYYQGERTFVLIYPRKWRFKRWRLPWHIFTPGSFTALIMIQLQNSTRRWYQYCSALIKLSYSVFPWLRCIYTKIIIIPVQWTCICCNLQSRDRTTIKDSDFKVSQIGKVLFEPSLGSVVGLCRYVAVTANSR